MEGSKKLESQRKNACDDKDDDDVSVIAIIGKENNRPLRYQQLEKPHEKQKERRVIELTDRKSKIAYRKQLDMESLSTEQESATEEYKNIKILQKLPPGTIVIKQKYKDDADYVRDSTETSSGGSTSGGAATNTRRIHRAVRKNRSTAEVRRNPIRVTKKDSDKDFPRPRQRLLSVKRKGIFLDAEASKRGKSSTMPYMNTRSVTRKMYNVGATYQAPTIRDETEWKEWPVHGMHERPVFHPQVGLAAEYLGRYFTSLDGLSYREIIDRPEIEVVSVDPHCDFFSSSAEKKRNKKTRSSRSSSNAKNSKTASSDPPEKKKSFESCMHESFHCVLGYCSQVMTPTYKTNVEGKINMLTENKNSSNVAKEMGKQLVMTNVVEQTPKNDSSINSKESLQKPVEENKLDNYTAAMTLQNVKNFSQIPKTRLVPAQKVYIANSQKSIAFTNLKTFQGGQMKIQDMVRSSKNPYILVNPSDTKDTHFLKSIPNNVNMIKIEDASVNEENLGEVSSVYKNLELNKDLMLKQIPTRRGNKVEFTVTKYLLDNMQQAKDQTTKDLNSSEKKLCYEISNKELNVKPMSSGLNRAWCANEASEIAKILSEYNKNNFKKSTTESQPFCSTKNIRVKELSNKDEKIKQNSQENSTDRNVNITFPQGKWRRFHLTVEKLKDLKNNTNDKRLSSGVQNKQPLFKIDQSSLDSSSERKVEISKHLETLQRGQPIAINLEKKGNASTITSDVDTTTIKTQSLQELLENTAMLYCAATGTHQDDLANYIDSLDAAQSIQWLEACKNLIA